MSGFRNIHHAIWRLFAIRAFVVDVDIKESAVGPQSIETAGGLRETMTVRSPSGGTTMTLNAERCSRPGATTETYTCCPDPHPFLPRWDVG